MKLVQLNIERNLHLDRFIPFLIEERADVVCLEEVMERTLPHIAEQLGMYASYAPMATLAGYESDANGDQFGVAFLSREPHTLLGMHYYAGTRDTVVVYHKRSEGLEGRESDICKVALVAKVEVSGVPYVIGATHFTWSKDGSINEEQRMDLPALFDKLQPYSDLVLCGDFNIPRGNELYHELAAHYTDNVPPEYVTSLDQDLHRKKGLQFMVDYIWSTPHYRVADVRMVCGVSDHCALVADVLHV